MESIINWHETARELPQPTPHQKEAIDGRIIKWKVDEPLLVIWEGRVKPSRYLTDLGMWEGHTKEQIPEYWIMLKEIKILEERKK